MRHLHETAPEDGDARADVARPGDRKAEALRAIERAAQAAAAAGVDLDQYMNAAWDAFMRARPEVREALADRQLLVEIDLLRQSGRLGSA